MFENREKARDELRRTPFDSSVATLTRTFPYFAKLSDADQQRRSSSPAQVLLAEKGVCRRVAGLALTDDIKVTIALRRRSCSCIATRTTSPRSTSSPSTRKRTSLERVVLDSARIRSTSSSSWDAIEKGKSVVLHELAHQLDQDGTAHDTALDKVLIAELGRLRDDVDRRHRAGARILCSGIKNVAELFAVATECSTSPSRPAERNPDLYAELERCPTRSGPHRAAGRGNAPRRQRARSPTRRNAPSTRSRDLSNEPRAASLSLHLRRGARGGSCARLLAPGIPGNASSYWWGPTLHP